MRRAANWKRVGEIGPAGRKAGQDFPSSFFFLSLEHEGGICS